MTHASPRERLDAWISPLRARAALGLPSVVAPAMLFVPLGYLLGPGQLDLLSESTLAHLAPLLSAALVTLGLFVGLATGRIGRDAGRLLAAAVAEASVTALVVGGTVGWLAGRWGLPHTGPPALFGAVIGLCTAASAAIAAPALAVEPLMTRVADLDDLAVIAAGGILVAQAGGVTGTIELAALAVLLGIAIAAAGWLLFESASGDAERGVFVIGTVLLLAGGAAYLRVSPLLVGAVAGAAWARAPGGAARIVRADLERLLHPLVVLLLLTAGATVTRNALTIWLLAPIVVFRLAGKVAGSWVAARLVPALDTGELAARLLPTGTVGIALALNFEQFTTTAVGPAVVSAIALSAVAFELLALATAGGGDR